MARRVSRLEFPGDSRKLNTALRYPLRWPRRYRNFTTKTYNGGFGSKCEELTLSKSSPLCPTKRTSMRGVATSLRARSRLIKWCAKRARQYDYDNVLSFLGVARDL